MKRDLVRAPPLWELKHRFLLPAVIFQSFTHMWFQDSSSRSC